MTHLCQLWLLHLFMEGVGWTVLEPIVLPLTDHYPQMGLITTQCPLSLPPWTLQDDTEDQCFQTIPNIPCV